MDKKIHIHFGLLGIKMGQRITFIPTEEEFQVASGAGTPDNGGTLVRNPGALGPDLFSLRAATRRLLAYQLNNCDDIWALWKFRGVTLRSIYEQRN